MIFDIKYGGMSIPNVIGEGSWRIPLYYSHRLYISTTINITITITLTTITTITKSLYTLYNIYHSI